jgi:hypothetical protein
MFVREFNRRLAYGAPWLDGRSGPVNVCHFAKLMNSTFVERQGFRAEYSGGRGVGLLEFNALFPVGVRDPGEEVDGRSEVKLGDLVPALEVSLAYDDAGKLWDGLGGEGHYRRCLIEVQEVSFPLDTRCAFR